MRIIESSSNLRIQKVKTIGKNRDEKLFLIEGKKLLLEAVRAGLKCEEIFVTPEVWAREKQWMEPLEGLAKIYQVSPRLFRSISDLETPQGILAMVQKPSPTRSSSITRFALFLISIRDPGNFGAILRAAEASGCEWVGYSSDCVDPFLPKVVRASMGSLFRIPLLEAEDSSSFLTEEVNPNVQTCGLLTRTGESLFDWRPVFPLIVCIGSETQGLPDDLPLTKKLSIPMKGEVESLNAAVAAAICLYRIASYFETADEHR